MSKQNDFVFTMNKTKWLELRAAMLDLEVPPIWYSQTLGGFRYGPDREWFYHFLGDGNFSDLLFVDVLPDNASHRQTIRAALTGLYLPGEEVDGSFRIYGFIEPGQFIDVLAP